MNETPVRLVRSLEASELGLANPRGIARVPETGGLYVFGPDGAVELSPAGRQIRSIEIPGQVGVSRRVTYDVAGDRLLMLVTGPLRLVEFDLRQEDDAKVPVVHDLSAVQIGFPVGIAMDPTTGEVVILDAEGPSLVRVQSTRSGFENRASVTVDLRADGIEEAGGIAFNDSTGHIHIIDPSEARLYELGVDGRVRRVRRLSELELGDMVSMVFTTSGDQTDEPSATSLYVVVGDDGAGRILEVSLKETEAPVVSGFRSEIINTFEVASFDSPSPDPSGLAYVSPDRRLVVVDGEVDETVAEISHFEGVSLWQLDTTGKVVATANISQKQPTTVAMTNEPTGVTWNPRNGHYFVSDDNVSRIFDLNPGLDGLVGTADDSWSSFPTSISGNNDPEGVAYDPESNSLFVVDGLNQEVYQYTSEGEEVGSFDVARYGVIDPEGVALNPASGTLFVLGGGARPVIVETATTGELLRTIAIDADSVTAPAGLVYAPASDGSDTFNFFVAFRGVDNNTDPDEVDGVVLEMSAPEPLGHNPPSVDAGPDLEVVLPAAATLQGRVSDDGLPDPPDLLLPIWSQIRGPGLVTFSEPTAGQSFATFTLPGTYTLRLSAFDGELTSNDDVVVIVTGTPETSHTDITIESQFDDAEERANGTMIVVGADLDMMLDGGNAPGIPNSAVGLRFNSVPIPQGATIVNAYVNFQSDEANSVATALTIRADATDNSVRFGDDVNDITVRMLTSTSIRWIPEAWFIVGEAGIAQRTPNLAGVVQEIVSRAGWSEANSLSLIISGSGQRVATAFETDPEDAATLHLEWILEN